MRWKIFYNDREPYTNDDGGPETAPGRGVQVIIQDHKDHIAELVTGADYYVWLYDRWWGVDLFGLYDYLLVPGWKKILFGRTLLQPEYNEIIRQANIEKTGWISSERKTT